LFIAIPLGKNISLFLNKIQGEIKVNGLRASWVNTSSMHLTLRFIGDTATNNIRKIIRAMETAGAAVAPFTLSAKKVGVFPDIKKARVIWSGVGGQIDQLRMLQSTLENNLEQEGIKACDKRFSPHFTLGRFKERVKRNTLVNIIENFQHYRSGPCLIKSMVLFKSDLKFSGAVHTKLCEISLKGQKNSAL
jgi:2'-5' RNA ligase